MAFLVAGCASPGPAMNPVQDVVSPPDTASQKADAEPPQDVETEEISVAVEPLVASDYCERGADVFCGFYVRCGRMDAPDIPSCQNAFVQACNARFEPIYVSLADRGLLELSAEGLEACTAHLGTVICEQQVFDLDGPCAGVWVGLQEDGGPCGPGIESFVCGEQSKCILGLDFCGTCQPVVSTGASCAGEARCQVTDHCLDDLCVPRRLPGETCDGDVPCALGSGCADGQCVADAWVAVGQPCDSEHNCPYKSACRSGVCMATVLQGEGCVANADCASGWCQSGSCAPYALAGEACSATPECGTGACARGVCAPPNFSCL